MRKPAFCLCENKDADQLRAFVFTIRIVQFLYSLDPQFQASSRLLWLYSPVCVGPGRKPPKTSFLRTRLKYRFQLKLIHYKGYNVFSGQFFRHFFVFFKLSLFALVVDLDLEHDAEAIFRFP